MNKDFFVGVFFFRIILLIEGIIVLQMDFMKEKIMLHCLVKSLLKEDIIMIGKLMKDFSLQIYF